MELNKTLCAQCKNTTMKLEPLVEIERQNADLHVLVKDSEGVSKLTLEVDFANGKKIYLQMKNSQEGKQCCTGQGWVIPQISQEPIEYDQKVRLNQRVETSSTKLGQLALNNPVNFQQFTGAYDQALEWLKGMLCNINSNPGLWISILSAACSVIQMSPSGTASSKLAAKKSLYDLGTCFKKHQM